MKSLVLAAAAVMMTSPAVAHQSNNTNNAGGAVRSGGSTPEGSAQGGVNANGERLICRRVENTGSRMAARRVCLTAPEWRTYNASVAD